MSPQKISSQNVDIVLVHGAWGDGSGWAKVIAPLSASGFAVTAAPLPLTSFADDIAALERALERVTAPVVLVGHAYAGAVIASLRGRACTGGGRDCGRCVLSRRTSSAGAEAGTR